MDPLVLPLARAFPGLAIVLCHCSGDGEATAAEARTWRDTIAALSHCPNVFAKVRGCAQVI